MINKRMTTLGANTAVITLFTGLIAAAILFFVQKARKKVLLLPKDTMKKALLLCILGGSGTTVFLTLAYSFLPVGTTMSIHYVYPVLVNLVCIIAYRERPSKALLLTLFCAVLGMSRFFEGVDHSAFLGLLIALASSLTWTFYLVFADKSGLSDEDPLTLAFWLCVLNAVVGGGMGAVSGYSFGEANALYFLAIAAAFALVYLTMVLAIRVCGAALMSVLSVFEPISAILLGLVFLHDSISPKHSQGVCIVLASITFFLVSNYLRSNKANRT